MTGRRLRIAGLHHVTLLCKDVERSVGFYRSLLGMRLVSVHAIHQMVSLVRRARSAIAESRFTAFREEFLQKFLSNETLVRAAS